MDQSSVPVAAFRATLPVMFGYIPLGMAFGVLFAGLGYGWHFATLMGVAIYAGAGQFMAVGLLAAGAGLVEIALTTLLLNARHMFYGLSLAQRFAGVGARKAYLIFGLTDETYSLLTGAPVPVGIEPARFYLWVTGLNQFYWVTGCTAGALLGAGITVDTQGLEFTLTALFVVLTIEQALSIREARPFIIALISAVAAFALVGSAHMLLAALTLTTILLLTDRRRRQWAASST